MTKKLMLFCSLVTVVLLSSCANIDRKSDQHTTSITQVPTNTETIKENVTQIPEVSNQPTIVPSKKPTIRNTEMKVSNNEAEKKDFSEIGFDLEKDESIGLLKLGLNAADVEKELGKAEEKTDEQEWGADGRKHQQWLYKNKGIELDMVRDGSNQLVNTIEATGKCKFLTKRGIGIGSKKNDVIEKYKNEIDLNRIKEYPQYIVAGTVYGGVILVS